MMAPVPQPRWIAAVVIAAHGRADLAGDVGCAFAGLLALVMAGRTIAAWVLS